MNQGMRDEIKKLVEKVELLSEGATTGPWVIDNSGSFYAVRVINADNTAGPMITGWDSRKRLYDLEFISHAREAMPALCAEVRRLDTEMSAQEQTLWSSERLGRSVLRQ